MSNEDEVKPTNRAGMWTKIDIKFMEDNHLTMSIEDIATQLQRNPITVAKYIKEKLGHSETEKLSKRANFEIRKSPVWNEIKKQFSDEEQDLFEYHWGSLMAQFKQDTLPSERMQILEVVRLELLLGRIMAKLREIDITVSNARDELNIEREVEIEERDNAKIQRLEIVIANCYGSHREMNREYKELSERKDKMIISIRGSREQRVKRIEESGGTLQTWMADLADRQEYRRELGIEMRKQQLAMEMELDRLKEYHKFADGSIEQPILNCDTIFEDNN